MSEALFTTIVLAFVNQKGGVGKTTSSLFIAFALAIMGYQVLFIDMDPQANATYTLLRTLVRRKEGTICEVLDEKVSRPIREVIVPTSQPNLKTVSGSTWLSTTATELVSAQGREFRLRAALDEVRPYYHFVIIDTPPNLELLTINALVACTHIIIPTTLKVYALSGIRTLLDAINFMRSHPVYKTLGLDFPILGVLVNQVRVPHTTNANTRLRQLQEAFGEGVLFQTQVPLNEKVEESNDQPISGYEYAPDAKGVKAYHEITKEIIARVL